MLYSIHYIPTIMSKPMNTVSAPFAPPLPPDWPPPSTPPISLDAGLQVHLYIRSITASKSISNLAQLRPHSDHDHDP